MSFSSFSFRLRSQLASVDISFHVSGTCLFGPSWLTVGCGRGKVLSSAARMLLIVMLWSLLASAAGQQVDDKWIDPYDGPNYDPGTQRMRKPPQPTSYSNEAEHLQKQAEATSCTKQVEDLHKQIEDQKKMIVLMSQQPTCDQVFKRMMSRLLKEMQRVGVPIDSTDVFYDAKIKLSRQTIMEIQTLLEGEDRWKTGALDNTISQILMDLKLHDYETSKWHFEDTFGMELNTVLKIGLGVLIIVVLICTELWSRISWFKQFVRLLVVCFPVSIVLNWLHLYKIAFAEHQNNVMKMDSFNEKCTGVKKIDWTDNLTEWYRSIWTLQDDPCKRYYDIVYINPILLVPPTKAIAVTITTFITEPLKHIGQGISEVLQVLLKDLPVTVQLLVFLIITIFAFMAFMSNKDCDELAGGDPPGPEHAPRHQPDNVRNNVLQRRPNRPREEPARVAIEMLRPADPWYSEDEGEESPASEQSLSTDSENQQEELEGATAAQTKPAESPQPKNKKIKGKRSLDELN